MKHAPWTAEEVAALNRFQAYEFVHPFTCPNEHDGKQEQVLVATHFGWLCLDCGYRQTWAHEVMFKPLANPFDKMKESGG